MIHFFENETNTVFAVQSQKEFSAEDISKLNWLFGNSIKIDKSVLNTLGTDFLLALELQ